MSGHGKADAQNSLISGSYRPLRDSHALVQLSHSRHFVLLQHPVQRRIHLLVGRPWRSGIIAVPSTGQIQLTE